MRKFFKFLFKTLFFILLFFISGVLITFGIHYSKISDKHYAFGLVVDAIFDKGGRVVSISPEYIVGDNFTIDGSVHMNFSSEEYMNKSMEDADFYKKNQLLHNLSMLDTTYQIQHDKKNGRSLAFLDQKIGEETILSGKYYIADSTQYYFIQGVLNQYVNNGATNYFESYVEDVTFIDNMNYLYYFIRDSIKNNVLEEDLNAEEYETVLNGESTSLGRVSYRITDKSYKTLLKKILKDLKKDSRAHQIVSYFVPNIDEVEIDDKRIYLQKNESYTVYIYVSKWFYQPLKCEVVHVIGDEKEIFSYEGDQNKGLFYYSLNNEAKYHATYESNSKKIDVIVYNRFDQEIGTIKGEKDKNNMMFTMTLELENRKYDVSYGVKNKDLDGKNYTRENTLSFKFMDQMVTTLQGNVEIISKIQEGAKVEEDVSSSVLKSTLIEAERNGMDTLRDRIRERLEK